MLFDMQKYIYSEILFNTQYIKIKHNVKKIPLEKKCYKKCTLFFSRALFHHSFTFNLQFLYERKPKVRLSKTVCRTFHFPFRISF